jgi:hypothetical protein
MSLDLLWWVNADVEEILVSVGPFQERGPAAAALLPTPVVRFKRGACEIEGSRKKLPESYDDQLWASAGFHVCYPLWAF